MSITLVHKYNFGTFFFIIGFKNSKNQHWKM